MIIADETDITGDYADRNNVIVLLLDRFAEKPSKPARAHTSLDRIIAYYRRPVGREEKRTQNSGSSVALRPEFLSSILPPVRRFEAVQRAGPIEF